MTLRNGFAHPAQAFDGDDDLDAMVDAAEQRSVIVQGVRCISLVSGVLRVQFHGEREALECQMKTGWPNSSEVTLRPTVKPRDGTNPAVIVNGYAYGDLILEEVE